jgi:hypothetical protein
MSDEQIVVLDVAGSDSLSIALELYFPHISLPAVLYLGLYRKQGDSFLPVADFNASWPLLENEDKARAWLERTKELFAEEVAGYILNNLGNLLYASGHRAMVEAGLVPFDNKAILRDHLAVTELLMREMLKIEGKRPRWSAIELANAISQAMRELPKQRRTYICVAKNLQESYPGKAPKSGGALKQLVRSLEINWMKIKRDTEKVS